MSRGRYPRRIKTRIPPGTVVNRYLASWDSRSLYYHPERFPRLESNALFGNRLPLALEIGCGTGEFLCALAHRQPAINFLGLDIVLKPLHRAVETAHTLGLANIRFVHADFLRLYPLLVPDSLLLIYVHFPVPRQKKKHQIFNEIFLDRARQALVPGGRISIRTDHADRFDEMLRLAADQLGFRKVATNRPGLLGERTIRSHNQLIWEGRGKQTRSFEIEKIPS